MSDTRTVYEVRLQEGLDPRWAHWFDDMTIVVAGEPATTILSGQVVDQAALHGLLGRIRDLGLTLLELRRIDE